MSNKIIDIPLFVTDSVSNEPSKVSGRRRVYDLDELDNVSDDGILIVHYKSKTYKITKSKFLSNLRLFDTSWDDLRFPLTGRNIDVVSGRLGYDFFNGTVIFASNARFNEAETVSMNAQMPHKWKEASTIKPHLHWIQQHATNIPNWLCGYIIKPKGATFAVLETDFSNFTLMIPESNVFTYTSGVLEQITTFPDIDMSIRTVSDNIHVCLWRDTGNVSGLFGSPGSDPSALTEHAREFDIHYEIDSFGSNEEFTK